MNEDSVRQRRLLDAQIERWTSEAKKLAESGQESAALELYRRAADELPGAPWLQHRTAELARKLKQGQVAVGYFRRAATAFQIAQFPKRAVAPLRTAWTLAIEGLPGTSRLLVDVAVELMQLHRRLGFAADASVTFERTNAMLRARGFSEIAPHVLERDTPSTRSIPPANPPPAPSSRAPASRSEPGAESDVAPRPGGHQLASDAPDSRGRASGSSPRRR